MITEKEWDRIGEITMSVVPTALGVLSLALGIMAFRRSTIALRRSGPVEQRAYYLDGQYLVSVRHLGQWNDIRDFVQPSNPDVLAVYQQFGPDPWALYDFVCQNINYRRDVREWWQTPSETLRSGYGDCEDTAILLTSLIRAGRMPAYTVLGNYQGYGHSWVTQNGFMYEGTYTRARLVPDPENYCPYILFSDQDVIELWPGALSEVFEVSRDEGLKLGLMAKLLR